MSQSPSRLQRSRIHFWLITGGIVIFIAAGAILVLLLTQPKTNPHAADLQAAHKKAAAATQKGEYATSLEDLKKVESKAVTPKEKVALYGQMAAAAASNGQLDQAITYLGKKHAADPSTIGIDAYVLGSYYERTGDIAKAIEQYELSIDYQKGHTNSQTSVEVANLQKRIESLQEAQ